MKPDDYTVVIIPLSAADGGGFVGYAPDLPGCIADGTSREEATARLADAIAAWLETCVENGRRPPEPGSALEKLRVRERALVEALHAALDYSAQADDRSRELEVRVGTLLALMQEANGRPPAAATAAIETVSGSHPRPRQ